MDDNSGHTNKSSNNKDVLNTQSFVCYTFPEFFILQNTHKKQEKQPQHVLKINRHNADIAEISRSEVRFDEKNYVFRNFSCFLGLVVLDGLQFLMFCDECRDITKDEFLQIYEIHNIFVVSFLNDHDLILSGKKRSILKKIANLNELLSRGFYYSLDYNLTRTKQHQDMLYKEEFTWNKSYILALSKAKGIQSQWVVPIIQGFVTSFSCYFEGNQLDYYLISRRSWQKGGPRYFDRGVNEDGWVANFVETEQILVMGSYIASDVQIRGSVPIYFEQRGLTTKVNISRSNQLSRQSFRKHFDYCRRVYDRTFCVNLLAMGKNGERSIIEEFEKHIKEENDPDIRYMYFDFHKKCGHDFSKVNTAVELVAEQKKNLCYYLADKSNGNVLGRPMGVFRTNCLDCLDRTNFFQAKLALQSVEQILQFFMIDMRQVFKRTAIQEMDSKENIHTFMKYFKNVWADNGDMISYHYTGTGSTHTDITRDGTRGIAGSFKHKFKTITRFYNQHFWDFDKMRMIALLMQNNQLEAEANLIPSKMKEREKEYSQFEDITLYVLTWKVSNIMPPSDPIALKHRNCDILVVGLQQVEPSSMFSFKTINEDRVHKWQAYFLKCLELDNKGSLHQLGQDKYIMVNRLTYTNSMLVVLAKSRFKDRLKDIETSSVPFGNYLSNKCAIVSRMYIDDTQMAFIGCQLDYGKEYSKNRVSNLRQIYSKAFQQEEVGKKKSDFIKETPVKILFGNLNTNINLEETLVKQKLREINNDYNECKGPIKANELQAEKLKDLNSKIQELMKSDELSLLKENQQCLRDYEQGEINFIPPYKYQKGKSKLDQSKCGGWVDRIIYDSEEPMINLEYGIHQIFLTDHLPVYAILSLRVTKENPTKKNNVYEQILKELRISQLPEQQQVDLL